VVAVVEVAFPDCSGPLVTGEGRSVVCVVVVDVGLVEPGAVTSERVTVVNPFTVNAGWL
jgi:hypothetical protein